MINNSTSFDIQGSQQNEMRQGYGTIDVDRRDFEKQREKDAAKKGIYGNNPNFALNQRIFVISIYH